MSSTVSLPTDGASADVGSAPPSTSTAPVLPYFERQQKRWCGLHCLNALEQRPAFDRKQLKAFADELFLMCAAIEDDTAAEGRRGRAGRVRAPASHDFGSAVEGNLDVQESLAARD